ncbi:MFS transporter [Anaeromyxobacter oryzae]|uniref:Major facilitator superfamily (MFS) profile domain-containing protein n=1 Tax=Anaeromyxobacter oryzae TaxID=2918170 RepID=A0ABN6MU57_9BACT|nr:MFS transporter [Anaeromyxobacter oryzae]BDG04021.1 hypothetical protein AMOR_30170 [Anaeromyxobacter oryzae]
MTTPPGDDPAIPRPRRPGPALLLAGLAVLAVFTVRGSAPPLFEAMRPELWLVPDRRLGWSITAFALAALAAALVTSRRLERSPAPPPGALARSAALAALGVASLLCAAARGPFTFLAARALAGAAAGVVIALVLPLAAADRPGPAARAWLATTAPGGLAVGYLGAGVLQRWPSWRSGFVLAGVLALAVAVLALRRGDAPGGATPLAPLRAAGLRAALARLRADRSRALTASAAVAWAFAVSALAAWLPAFLERSRGMPRPLASGGVGVLAVLVGFAGLWAGGRLARALAPRTATPDTWAAAATCGGAGLLALGVVTAWRPGLYLPALLGALLLVTAAAGPLAGALRAAVPEADRGALLPAALLAIALADAVAPVLVGALSDRLNSLGRAMFLVPLALLAAGALLSAAASARGDPRDQRPSASA